VEGLCSCIDTRNERSACGVTTAGGRVGVYLRYYGAPQT